MDKQKNCKTWTNSTKVIYFSIPNNKLISSGVKNSNFRSLFYAILEEQQRNDCFSDSFSYEHSDNAIKMMKIAH